MDFSMSCYPCWTWRQSTTDKDTDTKRPNHIYYDVKNVTAQEYWLSFTNTSFTIFTSFFYFISRRFYMWSVDADFFPSRRIYKLDTTIPEILILLLVTRLPINPSKWTDRPRCKCAHMIFGYFSLPSWRSLQLTFLVCRQMDARLNKRPSATVKGTLRYSRWQIHNIVMEILI